MHASTITTEEPAVSLAASPAPRRSRPGLWLLPILGIALGFRLSPITAPLQQDEYGPLYAVAERAGAPPGLTPPPSAPLVPVAGWDEVRARSVLPYGITNPLPVYHYLLYAVVQLLPITEWALRLPSLLAGLGCVVAVYVLGRWLAGPTAGLAGALLTAVEPMQVAVSTMARPYALANLACVLSFLALIGVLYGRRPGAVAAAGLGLGGAVALIAWMNPVLLLVGAAHAALVAYWLLTRARTEPWAGLLIKGLALVSAGAVSVLLVWPQLDYLRAVRQFYAEHRDYLIWFGKPNLLFVIMHNGNLLVVFLVALAAAAVNRLKERSAGRPLAEDLPVPAGPRVGPPLVVLGVLWWVLPQVAAVAVYYVADQSTYISRYLSYTALGAVLVLGALTTCGATAAGRLRTVGVTALALALWGASSLRLEISLTTSRGQSLVEREMQRVEHERLWRDGDVILLRSGFFEGDFLPDEIPPENRRHVDEVIAVPLRLLETGQTPKPVVVLSLSHYRSRDEQTRMGSYYSQRERFYGPELVATLKPYTRFWLTSEQWDRREFLICFLPWLADSLGTDLRVTVFEANRQRSFLVPAGTRPGQRIPGLHNRPDFGSLLLIERAPRDTSAAGAGL
jgi:hypothetical protein